MIAAGSRVGEFEQGDAILVNQGIGDKHLVGPAGKIAQTKSEVGENLPVSFNIPGHVIRRTIQIMPRRDELSYPSFGPRVNVLENQGRPQWVPLRIILGHDPCRIVREVARQQRQAIVENSYTTAQDSFAAPAGRIDCANPRCKSGGVSRGLAGVAQTKIESQPLLDGPVVLDERCHLSILC